MHESEKKNIYKYKKENYWTAENVDRVKASSIIKLYLSIEDL